MSLCPLLQKMQMSAFLRPLPPHVCKRLQLGTPSPLKIADVLCGRPLGTHDPHRPLNVPTGLQMCVQLVVVSLSAVFARAIYTAPFVSFDQDFAVAPLHPAGREFWIDFFSTATATAVAPAVSAAVATTVAAVNAAAAAAVAAAAATYIYLMPLRPRPSGPSVPLCVYKSTIIHSNTMSNFLVLTPMIQDFLMTIICNWL